MPKKWSIGILIIALVGALLLPATASAAPPPKTVVCHGTGDGSFHPISVSAKAVQAHLNHGDALPGEAVPGTEDGVFGFGDSCTPIFPVTVLGPERGDESFAIQAALDVVAAELGVPVIYDGSDNFGLELYRSIALGDPSDIAMIPQPGELAALAEAGHAFALPDDVAENIEWPQSWQDLGTFDGVQYGVPTKADLKSLVWFDPDVFAAEGYTVPTTLTELYALSDQMIADEHVPWCVTIESGEATGWVFTDWMEDLLLRRHGAEVYDQWVNHEIPFNDQLIVDIWNEVLDIWNSPGAVFDRPNVTNTSFFIAGFQLLSGECLMMKQASFFSQIYAGEGVEVGVDIDAFYLPTDGEDMPVLGSGIQAGAFRDAPEVWAVMEFLGSSEYADARQAVQMSGFLTAATGVDLSLWSPTEQNFIAIVQAGDPVRFDASDLMPADVGAGTFWQQATMSVDGLVDAADATAIIEASWPD